ncbi:MAG: DUF4268 domain-containing protein [Crocinitomicaceae bacterium]|nr:DUF4268 domain-containing protein [Crocinitomicaceae bacterium]
MLSKEALKERNTTFWNEFRKQMRGVKSSNGKGINWINYPTGVKDVYLRMQTSGKGCVLSFEIQPKDDGVRSILWEQMTELKRVMENEMGPATAWNEFSHRFSGRNVSRIYWEDTSLNFYDFKQTEAVKAFFKEKLIAFDTFYQEYKEILISLAE